MEIWTFSQTGESAVTSSIPRPQTREAALEQLSLAMDGGWWYIDRGYGWEHVTLVHDEVFNERGSATTEE
jgi:hypothetical protein